MWSSRIHTYARRSAARSAHRSWPSAASSSASASDRPSTCPAASAAVPTTAEAPGPNAFAPRPIPSPIEAIQNETSLFEVPPTPFGLVPDVGDDGAFEAGGVTHHLVEERAEALAVRHRAVRHAAGDLRRDRGAGTPRARRAAPRCRRRCAPRGGGCGRAPPGRRPPPTDSSANAAFASSAIPPPTGRGDVSPPIVRERADPVAVGHGAVGAHRVLDPVHVDADDALGTGSGPLVAPRRRRRAPARTG